MNRVIIIAFCILSAGCYPAPRYNYDPDKDPAILWAQRQDAERDRQIKETNTMIGLDRETITNLTNLEVLQFEVGYKEEKDSITYYQTCEETKFVPDTISTYTSYDGGGTIDTPPPNSFPMEIVKRKLIFYFDADNKVRYVYDSFQKPETFHMATCAPIK